MKSILTLFALLVSAVAFAGGDLVNNGGGLAEKNVLFAYQKLDSYLRLCLSSEMCRIEKSQRDILEKIAAGLPAEKQNAEQIKFDSERKNPGFFIIDGTVKVAKTGSNVGSPIHINTDLLYSRNEMGYYIPVSISEAVSILVHELGHHYGNFSHADLDLVGVRVAMMLNYRTYSTPLLPWSQQISATVINANLDDSFPDMLLNIDDQVLDISENYKSIASCPSFIIPIPILPLPDIPVAGKKPLGSLVHNVHWLKMKSAGGRAVLSIEANISHKCKKTTSENVRSQDFTLQIDFSLTQDAATGKWSVDKDSLVLTQKIDSWWKLLVFNTRN